MRYIFNWRAFFLTAADNMLVQKTQITRFLESLPFRILLVVKAEEEVIEISYKFNNRYSKPFPYQTYAKLIISAYK